MALTNTKLKTLIGKERERRLELPDRDGLYVVAGKSGKVSWVFRYRLDGKSKRITLGSYPAYSLDDAREKCVKYRRLVEDDQDPKQAEQKSDRRYIDDCAKEWLDNYVVHLRKGTQNTYRSSANLYFSRTLLSVDVEMARLEEWVSYFDKVAKTASRKTSGSLLKTVKSMLRFCLSRAYIKKSKVFDLQLKSVGEKSTVGQRTLGLHEVALLWRETGKTKATPAIKSCVKLLIIFGARNSEIREAHCHEFDFKQGVWTIPPERSKTKKIIRRAIPEKAKQLITELNEVYGKRVFLIPGQHNNTPMTTHSLAKFIKRTWLKLHRDHGIDEFIAHDFRRTLSTRLSEHAVLPHVTEKMLGHELQGVMAVYNKHDWIEEQAKAYSLWCDLIIKATHN